MKLPFSKTGGCLTNEELAHYRFVEGVERERMDLHLAGCPDCLELIPVQTGTVQKSDGPSKELVRRIQSLPFRIAPRRSRRKFVPTPGSPFLRVSLAAGLLLTIGAFLSLSLLPDARKEPVQVRTPEGKEKGPEPGSDPLPQKEISEDPGMKKERHIPGPEPVRKKIVQDVPEEKKQAPDLHPVPEKKPEKRPSPVPQKPRETIVARLPLSRISGNVMREGKALSSGELVSPGDLLRTPFGAEARIEFSGMVLRMDHRTQIRVKEGPRVTLDRGKVFIQSVPGLEVRTPAGTIFPIGTDFLVETDQKGTTSVIVREGRVRFGNSLGSRNVPSGCRSIARVGRKPGPAQRIRNLSSLFSWVDSLDRALTSGQEASVRLYSTGKRSSLVITAPHVPIETQSGEIASFLAETLESPLVVGRGYKSIRGIDLNEPGKSEESRSAYLKYVAAIRTAADRLPLPFLVEIHAYGVKDGKTPVIEIATSGFRKGELERLKRIYVDLLEKVQPKTRARLVFDLTDPTYEVDGQNQNFRYGCEVVRKTGVFQKQFSKRGWKVELPWEVRYTDQESYRTILAELIRSVRR